jgi:hypothetical protein
LVEIALPTRLAWLAVRRTNHRTFEAAITGSWLVVASDGPCWRVTVDGNRVESRPAERTTTDVSARIEGTSRDLLALLLGRSTLHPLRYSGDVAFAVAFTSAFPGP